METTRRFNPIEMASQITLGEYGGVKGLAYYGFRLATLNPEQLKEYFELKRQEAEFKSKFGDFQYRDLLKQRRKQPGTVFSISAPQPAEYKRVMDRIKELEKIMDEKVPVNKKEFVKQLYL